MDRQLRVLFAASLVIYATGFGLVPLLPVYLLGLGATPATVGASLACVYLALAVGTVGSSWLAGVARGRKRLFVVMGAPAIPALPLLGRVDAVWQVTALTSLVWFCAGVGIALINVLEGLHADPDHRGKAFGLLALALPAGAVVGATSTGALVEWFGFPVMFALLGLTWLALPLLGALGLDECEGEAPVATSCAVGEGGNHGGAVALLVAATLLGSLTIIVGRLGTSLSMQALGFAPGAIGSTMAVGGLVALPLLPATGALSDRLGRRGLLLMADLLAAGGVLALAVSTALWHFWLAATLISVAYYVTTAIAAALATDLLSARVLAKGLPLLGATTWVAAIVGFAGTGYLVEALGAANVYRLAALPAAAPATLIGLLHYERCVPPAVQARLEGRLVEAGRAA